MLIISNTRTDVSGGETRSGSAFSLPRDFSPGAQRRAQVYASGMPAPSDNSGPYEKRAPWILTSAIHLSHRVIRRVLDIPRKGLPVLHGKKAESAFDQEYGVETAKLVWFTNIFSKNYGRSCRYEACNPLDLQWAIKASAIDPTEFTFIDVGCGKGRPLLVASKYAFPKLIGVEYSARLCKQAIANLRKCKIPEDRFDVVCADATQYVFPEGDLFTFFYNPFDGTILRAVLENLRPHKGRLFIAFVGQFRGELANHDWLRLVDKANKTELYERIHL
jgi:SAM-dependent methyltransferase